MGDGGDATAKISFLLHGDEDGYYINHNSLSVSSRHIQSLFSMSVHNDDQQVMHIWIN
jgi:hypothetical protein